MSYTMTFDASHKVGRGGAHARGFVRHIARDVDTEAGFVFAHANKNIVADRTALNFTRVNDGAGDFRALRSVDGSAPSEELENYLSGRLAAVVKPLRKDAVVMRGIILQLDPKWFDDHNSDWRKTGLNKESVALMGAALEWACEEFGQKNIVGFSVHLDEYSPQVQVMFTPVTEDGRLAQKHFFKGPADFRRQHKELREHMDAAGYDVEFRVTERSREHLSSSEFQARADRLRDETADVEDAKATYEGLLIGLASRKADLERREAEVLVTEVEIAAAHARATQVTEAAHALELSAKTAQIAAQRLWKESERERDSLRAANSRLELIPPDVERWLDKAKFNGRPVREHFNEASVKAHASRVEVQRLVDSTAIAPQRGRTSPQLEK
jgi:hypothetical protein